MNTDNEKYDAAELDQARLTAYALGQLNEKERAEVERLLSKSDDARQFVAETAALAGRVRVAYRQTPPPAASPSLQAVIEQEIASQMEVGLKSDLRRTDFSPSRIRDKKRRWWHLSWIEAIAVSAVSLVLLGVLFLPAVQASRKSARHTVEADALVENSRRVTVSGDAARIMYENNKSDAKKPISQRLPSQDKKNRRWQDEALLEEAATSPGHTLGEGRMLMGRGPTADSFRSPTYEPNTEQYDNIAENDFHPVGQEPLSTFSIDVDTASYSNVRRFLSDGQWPPPDAVRIEEMINYFVYDYPQPQGDDPFSVNIEAAECPWQPEHRLLRIGLKAREIDRRELGPSNLVFLLDVSGSMNMPSKLPLVKQSMRMLVEQLSEDDRVAIVTYASGTNVPLPSARGDQKQRILAVIDELQAGGSTYGSAGIELAYEQAARHFVPKGINRVILCTDGDLNVGITDDAALERLITDKAKSGVFLTVLGFGTGNLKDSKMEKLADRGNGLYAYVDCLREARRVLVEQMTGSLATVAKDVKLQIEFNPAEVAAYRLVGYENRRLANRDFDDDRKDAGEIGAGHSVTALYELVPAYAGETQDGERALKYQRVPQKNLTEKARSGELLTLRLRYKQPDGQRSKLMELAARDSGERFSAASADFRFAAAVAAFGMALRDSSHKGGASLAAVEEYAAGALGHDPNGHRAEFLDLVRRAKEVR